MVRGSAATGCSPITAVPTARNPGEKPVQRLVSHQNAPGRTPHEPTAKPSGMASCRLRLHHNLAGGVGVFDGLPDLNRAEPVVAPLCGDL
jgi:hypothetical protein